MVLITCAASAKMSLSSEVMSSFVLVLADVVIKSKATGNSRSGIQGNRGPPKFPTGIPGNFEEQ